MYHCPYCKECKLGEGLGIDYNHCKGSVIALCALNVHNEEVTPHKCKNNLAVLALFVHSFKSMPILRRAGW